MTSALIGAFRITGGNSYKIIYCDFSFKLVLFLINDENKNIVQNTGYESYKYKITNISHNHKNSYKITIIYKNSQKITTNYKSFVVFL